MSPDTIAIIISVSIVVLAIAIIVTVIVSKIRHLSRTLFGTSSLIEGIQGVKEDQEQMRETPRSLHGMTSVYMPMIKKDFPELDVEQYMNKTRSLLRNYFSAVESKRLGVIAEEVTPNFTNYVQGIIDQLSSVANTQHYEDVNIYDVQIARYIKNGATVTVGESKVSASGTYLSLTWNFGQDKASYEKFHKIISGDTIHNWIYCRITDSNGNTFDTKTDSETFSSIYFDSNDTGDDHWNTSGESTYVDDDGNYCFHTNILLPALTQDFTALEVTPYLHLEDGTETDLDFASFRVDYE
mgnify:CR=1 FL=1